MAEKSLRELKEELRKAIELGRRVCEPHDIYRSAAEEYIAALEKAIEPQIHEEGDPIWAPDGITCDDLIDDPVRQLVSDLMRPTFVLNMTGALLTKKLSSGDKSSAAASAETRYRNARREILAVLTEYQEKQ